MPEQRVVVLVGLPGSGKSTWGQGSGVVPISSDELRRWLRDDAGDQGVHARVFHWMRELLRDRIALGASLSIVDATNLLRKHRRAFIRIAKYSGCRCEAIWFDTPLDECLRRNAVRDRNVPESAIREMARRMEPPTTEEGFDKVIRILPYTASTAP